jgi:hypothetical protein
VPPGEQGGRLFHAAHLAFSDLQAVRRARGRERRQALLHVHQAPGAVEDHAGTSVPESREVIHQEVGQHRVVHVDLPDAGRCAVRQDRHRRLPGAGQLLERGLDLARPEDDRVGAAVEQRTRLDRGRALGRHAIHQHVVSRLGRAGA